MTLNNLTQGFENRYAILHVIIDSFVICSGLAESCEVHSVVLDESSEFKTVRRLDQSPDPRGDDENKDQSQG